MSNRGQIWQCLDVTCGTSPEARDEEQAREAHDLFEDHPFQPARTLPGAELDQHPELFRVVTDGCGRLLAVTEDGELLGVVELDRDCDRVTELNAHRSALHKLVDGIVEDLVDPTDQ